MACGDSFVWRGDFNRQMGDIVLAHVEKASRYFGMRVDETLIER